MKLKDVIYQVANLISMTDVVTILDKREQEMEQGETYAFDSNEYTKIKKMVSAVSSALEMLAEEYVPFVATEILRTNGECKVLYSAFKNKPIKVVDAVAVNTGAKSYVAPQNDAVVLANPNVTYYVKYHFVPAELGVADLDKDVQVPLILSKNVLSFATAKMVSLLSTNFDEADAWGKKMKDSLSRSTFPAREIKVGRRKFL